MSDDLTGLLLTRNRHKLLQLNLPIIENYAFPIIILDGSDCRNSDIDQQLSFIKNIRYLYLPKKSGVERLKEGLNQSASEFILPLTDDDLLFPECVYQCISYLRENKDYVAAQGSFWTFSYSNNDGVQSYLEEYSPSIINSDTKDRLATLLRYYAHIFYSVQRRKAFYQGLVNTIIPGETSFVTELAHAMTVVAMGNIKRFTEPYCVRSPTKPEVSRDDCLVALFEKDPEGLDNTLTQFVKFISQQYPFNKLYDHGEIAAFCENILQQFIFSELNPLAQIHRNYKYFIRMMNSLAPEVDAILLLEDVLNSEFLGKHINSLERILRLQKDPVSETIPARTVLESLTTDY